MLETITNSIRLHSPSSADGAAEIGRTWSIWKLKSRKQPVLSYVVVRESLVLAELLISSPWALTSWKSEWAHALAFKSYRRRPETIWTWKHFVCEGLETGSQNPRPLHHHTASCLLMEQGSADQLLALFQEVAKPINDKSMKQKLRRKEAEDSLQHDLPCSCPRASLARGIRGAQTQSPVPERRSLTMVLVHQYSRSLVLFAGNLREYTMKLPRSEYSRARLPTIHIGLITNHSWAFFLSLAHFVTF